MRIVTPLRFVSGVVGLWIGVRVAILLPGTPPIPDVVAPAPRLPARQAVGTNFGLWPKAGAYRALGQPPPRVPEGSGITGLAGMTRRGSAIPPLSAYAERSRGTPSSAAEKPRAASSAAPGRPRDVARGKEEGKSATVQADSATASTDPTLSPTGLVAPLPANPSRWSGSAYLFRRSDSGTPALASGGQLGGSQAGGRIAYRLNPAGPPRLALAARVSAPLNDRRGVEAAAGLDFHPVPGAPLRLSVERRVDLGGAARNAWSAYAAGGFWKQAGAVTVDGYAQAGVVGTKRRDLFADGALRIGRRAELGAGRSLTIGAGAWAAAQPRVERLDLGPRAALGFPLGGTAVTAAAEWRIRVAGDASPRSGLAFTLAADF